MAKKTPGKKWRVLSQGEGGTSVKDAGTFDELVVDSWLHIEQMSARHYWMRLGPLAVNVTLGADGRAKILIEQDGGAAADVEVSGEIAGETEGDPWWGRKR